MSQPSEERTYDELLELCTKLEAESGRHLVMQQDLIKAKNSVDVELMRFKAIQNYIAKVLDASAPEEFYTLTLEAIIEAFEVEVALFLEIAPSKKTLNVSGQFGFEVGHEALPFSDAWLNANDSVVLSEDDFLLQAWVELDLSRAIICRYHDKDGNFAGAILGGVTRENAELYDQIGDEHRTAFTVMVQQAGSLWANGELSDQIRQQNQRLGNLTDSYSRFVPFQFLKLLGRESIEEIDAGDHVSLETSVLFADIRGFTTLSEALGPAGTFSALNEFLISMEPIVDNNDGFINQYLGDAIMALFPGPVDDAINCAAQMLEQSRALNARRSGSGELAIRFGVGINSGPLMLGAIGGGGRLDSNVVGDTANLASRVESLTKVYGVSTLFTESTRARLENQDGLIYRELDRVVVKGKSQAVSIYELVSCDTEPLQAQKQAAQEPFAEGLSLYREGDFLGACSIFEECVKLAPDDNVMPLYIERCRTFHENPPGDDWQGVWVLDEK